MCIAAVFLREADGERFYTADRCVCRKNETERKVQELIYVFFYTTNDRPLGSRNQKNVIVFTL